MVENNNPVTNAANTVGGYTLGAMGSAGSAGLSAAGTVLGKGGIYWVWLAVGLYFLDWAYLGFNGINFPALMATISSEGPMWMLKAAVNAVVLIILVSYIIFGRHKKEEIMAFSFAVMLTSIIISLVGFALPSMVHLVFAWVMYFGLLSKAMEKQDAYITLAVILFIDFFAFSILASFSSLAWITRLIIPIYFLMAINYTKESGFKSFLIAIVVIFYLLQVATTAYDYKSLSAELDQNQKVTALDAAKRAWNNLKSGANQVIDDTTQKYEDTKNQTKKDLLGTSYVSEVDANSKKDLGVTLENVEAFSSEYMVGDNITVTALLKGKSIENDKKLTVFVTCSAKSDYYDEAPINGTIDNQKIYEITMGLYEQKYIQCNIRNASKSGSWTISISAVFNYTSQGYLKSYFMDKDKYLTLRSQTIDVFDTYGITEKNPISKSVNGPGKIGLDTLDPPTLIPVNNEKEFNSFVGVSISNNWPGKILRINNIHITIPQGFQFSETCGEHFDLSYQTNPDTNELTYGLNDGYINTLKTRKISDIVSEKCGLTLTSANDILENAPFTTKYFKAEVDYAYELKKSTTTNVKTKK